MVKVVFTIFTILFIINLRICQSPVDEIIKLEAEHRADLDSSSNHSDQHEEHHPNSQHEHVHHNIESENHSDTSLLQNITELKKEEEIINHYEDNEAFTEKLINEMGFNQGTIKKENFKKFLFRLITKDEQIDESETEFYYEVIDKIAKNMTEEIDHTELHQHIEHNKFVEALDSVIGEKYGENVLKEVQSPESENDKAEL